RARADGGAVHRRRADPQGDRGPALHLAQDGRAPRGEDPPEARGVDPGGDAGGAADPAGQLTRPNLPLCGSTRTRTVVAWQPRRYGCNVSATSDRTWPEVAWAHRTTIVHRCSRPLIVLGRSP